jgi:hypothetical protein
MKKIPIHKIINRNINSQIFKNPAKFLQCFELKNLIVTCVLGIFNEKMT